MSEVLQKAEVEPRDPHVGRKYTELFKVQRLMSRLLGSLLKPPEQRGITSYGRRDGWPSFVKRDPRGKLARLQYRLCVKDAPFDADI